MAILVGHFISTPPSSGRERMHPQFLHQERAAPRPPPGVPSRSIPTRSKLIQNNARVDNGVAISELWHPFPLRIAAITIHCLSRDHGIEIY